MGQSHLQNINTGRRRYSRHLPAVVDIQMPLAVNPFASVPFESNSCAMILFSHHAFSFQMNRCKNHLTVCLDYRFIEPIELLTSCCCFTIADIQTEINIKCFVRNKH